MKRVRGAITIACMFCLLLLCCAERAAPPSAEPSPSPSAEDRGVARAKADIASGKMRILHYGKPWSLGEPLVDAESGLPVEIVAGCGVLQEFAAETDAYNRTMREAAGAGK